MTDGSSPEAQQETDPSGTDARDPSATEPEREADDEENDGESGLTDLVEGVPSTEQVRAEAEAGHKVVSDVRVGTHEGFDRVVIEVAGEGAPGWHVEYVDEPITQSSGREPDLPGAADLLVSVRGLTNLEFVPEDLTAQRWEEDLVSGGEAVVTGVFPGDLWEGSQGFFVGIDRERPFVVGLLEDPFRIVVDVLHES